MSRVAEATERKLGVVKEIFAAAHVPFPPSAILLRAFKQEREVELWAATHAASPLTHVATYGVCAMSGELGPKRRRGDFMVPEGYYTITGFSPTTPYHLAMIISYPNVADRILGARDPGDEIMLHGSCASVGCIAVSDDNVEEIWLAARAVFFAGRSVPIHIFPAHDTRALIARSEKPEHRAFWENLAEGLEDFDREHRIPTVQVDTSGRYRLR